LETILGAGNNNLTTVSKNSSSHICGPKSWENEWERDIEYSLELLTLSTPFPAPDITITTAE
jgi:hypothetical protein